MVLGEKGHLSWWVRLPNRQSDGLTASVSQCECVGICVCVCAGKGEGCGLWERCGYLYFSHCPLLTHVMENFTRGSV